MSKDDYMNIILTPLGMVMAICIVAIFSPETLTNETIVGISVAQFVGFVVAGYALVLGGAMFGQVLYNSTDWILQKVGLFSSRMTCCEKIKGDSMYRVHHVFGEEYEYQCPTCKNLWVGK